jgi:cytochrome c
MTRKILPLALALAASAMLFAGGAGANADLAKAKGCLNCHDAEKKKVGPALKDIAKAGKPKADLVARLKEGKGHPKANATDEELGKLADYVLSMK